MKKEHPILYSTPMVQAKLAGTKTVTRRVTGLDRINAMPDKWHFLMGEKGQFAFEYDNEPLNVYLTKCPYGNVGDLLWVRETFAHNGLEDTFFYKADRESFLTEHLKWKPSIHMPKRAARIWDEIIEIKVERLHDITEEDAIAEGIEQTLKPDNDFELPEYRLYNSFPSGKQISTYSPVESYKSLWISINGPESWDLNPWVWVIRTKTLSTTGKPAAL